MSNKSPEIPRSVTIAYAGGEMKLKIGQEFTMFGGDRYKIEAITSLSIYSPSGSGGTPIVECSYIGGEPPREDYRSYVKDNRIDFCTDSVALAISEATNPPTS